MEREHAVISTKLLAGRTRCARLQRRDARPGFDAAEPDLEDVYFSTMAGHMVGAASREPKVRP